MSFNDEMADSSEQLGASVSSPPAASQVDTTRTNIDSPTTGTTPAAALPDDTTKANTDVKASRKRQISEITGGSTHGVYSSPDVPVCQLQSAEVSSCSLPAKKPRKSLHEAKRCRACDRKLKIVSTFSCRCGFEYCGEHRCPETHACNFDYRELGRREIKLNNPPIRREKIAKI